jgi:sporulation protein YlmC with PRC-barrel domain
MPQTFILALLLASSPSFAAQTPDEGVEPGALALRQLIGSRVVVDSESDLGVDVVGAVEDLVLDIETGLVTRVLVRDAAPAAKPVAQETEPLPLRSVSLDSLSLAASGGRAIVTFAYSAEDYRSLPIYDAAKDLRPEDGKEARLFTASDLGRMSVQSSDGVELGAIRDLWIDIGKKRVDFIEHAIEKGHAAAPWSVMVWTRAEGKLASVKISRDAAMVRGVPRIDVEKKHTLKHREYRELVFSAYGVKKEPDTSVGARI